MKYTVNFYERFELGLHADCNDLTAKEIENRICAVAEKRGFAVTDYPVEMTSCGSWDAAIRTAEKSTDWVNTYDIGGSLYADYIAVVESDEDEDGNLSTVNYQLFVSGYTAPKND